MASMDSQSYINYANRYNAGIAEYNKFTEYANPLYSKIEFDLSQATSYSNRARALGIIGMWEASLGLSGKASQFGNEALSISDQIQSASNKEITLNYAFGMTTPVYGYDSFGFPVIVGETTQYFPVKQKVQGIAELYKEINYVADILKNAKVQKDFYSFGVGFNSGGFTITNETIQSISSFVMSSLIDSGIIPKSTKPAAMAVIYMAGAMSINYGISSILSSNGMYSTPLGYMSESQVKKIFTNDVLFVFNTFNGIQKLYGAYQVYKDVQKADAEYKAKQAEFEEYIANMKIKSEESSSQMSSYVSGRYYRYFAGQSLFNVGQGGRERYVPMTAQEPSYGIFHQRMTNEDEFINKLLWKDKNYNLPAGGSFMNQQMSGAMVQLGN